MSILKINKLVKAFKQEIVLDGIDFEIKAGEKCAFIGLNGQGKTTLIKSILGLNNIKSGTVEISDNHFYLPEKFNPSSNFTGNDYLNLMCHSGTRSESGINSGGNLFTELPEIPDQVGDDKFFNWKLPLDKKIKTYSKGMKQKLGLLIAFNSDANLLILDEPMSGLDLKSRAEFRQLVTKFNGAVLFTTHIMEGMDEIADRVIFLHNKKLLLNKPAQDINFSQFEREILSHVILAEAGIS